MSSTVILPEPPEGPEPASGGRRTAVVAAITAGTLAVVGVGAYAAVQFLSGGAGAESAMPAQSTLAVVSLDLDPSAKQKIEALKTLQKFPELKKQLKLGSGDDLRKKFFDEALRTGDCKSLSYESDIKPWIGDNVAVAAAEFDKGRISPLVSLAVTDQDKAARGLDALIACSKSSKSTAYAFNGDFVLITDTKAHADLAVSQAKTHALSDDAGYKTWTGKVGDRGILNFYVAKAAAQAFGDYAVDYSKELGSTSSGFATLAPTSATTVPSGLPTEMPLPGTTSTVPGTNPTPGTLGQPGATITASPATGSNSGSGSEACPRRTPVRVTTTRPPASARRSRTSRERRVRCGSPTAAPSCTWSGASPTSRSRSTTRSARWCPGCRPTRPRCSPSPSRRTGRASSPRRWSSSGARSSAAATSPGCSVTSWG